MFLPSTITLKPGDSGDFVAELQRRLATVDCFSHDAINGFYDGMTTNAVSTFQSRHGLSVDGIAGPETLRRLNGVISGDTSSTTSSNQAEEEAKQEAARNAFLQQGIVADQQPVYIAPIEEPVPLREAAPAAIEQYHAPAPQAHVPLHEHTSQSPQQAPHPGHHQAPGVTAADLLAQMLAATPPPLQQAAAAEHPVVAQHPPQTHQPQPVALAPEQPRGMVGRAMQFASEFMQKLANYFEAKLPPSVLNEVQAIGHAMKNHGVKEAPIPGETPTRTAELPARGPEHAQQRG